MELSGESLPRRGQLINSSRLQESEPLGYGAGTWARGCLKGAGRDMGAPGHSSRVPGGRSDRPCEAAVWLWVQEQAGERVPGSRGDVAARQGGLRSNLITSASGGGARGAGRRACL